MPADADYLKAVKSGDVQSAQKMVNEAAEKSGLPILDDSATEAYAVRRTPAPKKTETSYKLFATRPDSPGELFPLFVGATDAIPQGIWLESKEGPEAAMVKGRRKVKSKIGKLAYRPGWHSGDIPLATHIGVKDSNGRVYARRDNEVWAEVEVGVDKDYQPEANKNGINPKTGKFSEKFADIKRIPVDGMYRFKTNANMTGTWLISGSMKINRILTQAEVDGILKDAGHEPMPWQSGPLDLETRGLGTDPLGNQAKVLDPVTYDNAGEVIPLSERFQANKSDARYMPEKVGDSTITKSGDGSSIIKTKSGKYRVYGANKALLGIASSQKVADRILQRGTKKVSVRKRPTRGLAGVGGG